MYPWPLRFPNFLEEQICCSNRVTLTEIWTPLTGADFLPFRFVTRPTKKKSKAVLPCVVFPATAAKTSGRTVDHTTSNTESIAGELLIKVQTLSENHVSHSWVSTRYFIVVMMTKILHTQAKTTAFYFCLSCMGNSGDCCLAQQHITTWLDWSARTCCWNERAHPFMGSRQAIAASGAYVCDAYVGQ